MSGFRESHLAPEAPIRVCFIATGADLGGAPRSLLEMVKALLETGRIDPYVMLRSGGMLEDALDGIGVCHEVFHFPSAVRSKRLPDAVKLASFPVYERALARRLRRGGFDIVHNNGVFYDVGVRAAKRAGIPCVCHIREYAQLENGIEFCDEGRVRESVGMADRIIFISDGVAGRFDGWCDKDKATVLFNGFDVARYHRKHTPLFEGGCCRLLLAGHIMPTKGQMEAVRALEVVRNRGYDAHLTIIGLVKDADYHRAVVGFIEDRELWDSVDILEFSDDLGEVRAASDVSLICSTANEGLGRVTVEGMLAGCLAIGSDAGGTAEIISNGETGLLYDAHDYLALADRIEYAICHRERMREIAARGQAYALESFDSKRYADKLCALYRDILTD